MVGMDASTFFPPAAAYSSTSATAKVFKSGKGRNFISGHRERDNTSGEEGAS